MTATKGAIRWCAVYTRKSSEEGLEQQFNSLHAQREAGEAYIKSQRHEGWRLLAEKYDDGVTPEVIWNVPRSSVWWPISGPARFRPWWSTKLTG